LSILNYIASRNSRLILVIGNGSHRNSEFQPRENIVMTIRKDIRDCHCFHLYSLLYTVYW